MSRATTPAHRNGSQAPAPNLFAQLEANKGELTKLLGTDQRTDRFLRVLRNAVLANPALTNYDPRTLIQCAMRAAELRLEPNGLKGHCYFVPFKGDVALVMGWKGLLELAHRTGLFASLATREVYANDSFELVYDPEPRLVHRPADDEPGPIVRVYAYARTKDGGLDIEVMRRDQVEAIRKASPSANSPAWRDHWGEMARKVVLKRFLKRVPLSDDLATALEIDNAVDGLEAVQRPAHLPPAATRSAALAASLGASPEPEAGPEPTHGAGLDDFPDDELEREPGADG